MNREERNRERRLRTMVARLELMTRQWGGVIVHLVKNESRDKQAKGYGGYMYVHFSNEVNKVAVLAGGEPYLYSLSLAAAEEYAKKVILPGIQLYQQLESIDDHKERRPFIDNWHSRHGDGILLWGNKLLSMRLV